MADVNGLGPSNTRVGTSPTQSGRAAGQRSHNAGAVRGEPDAADRPKARAPQQKQFVMVDGMQLDRSAPRGTYLDILV